MHPSPRRRSAGGFTLIELLVGAAVGMLLVAAMADGLGLFSQQIEQVRAETDQGPDEAVALMTDMARHGWSVEEPAAGQLDIVDASGGRTSFVLDDGDLVVTRPSGASGTLLDDVAALSIQTDTVQRLREATPLDDYRAWWERPVTGPLADSLTLENGLPVALGFTMASEVPDSYDVVDGVAEHAVEASLLTLSISMSYVGVIPADPNEPTTGGSSSNGNGNKVEICHIPPGNPSNAHTLSINQNAVDAHLAHGDTMGPCAPPPPPPPTADLVFTLYEARAPDDARPHGPALATMGLVAAGIPTGSASWVLTQTGVHSEPGHSAEECAATTPSGKVVMCHVPPGNPSNAHSIEISPNAAAAHLAHGDYYGCCGEHEATEDVYTLSIDSAPTEVSLDLSPLGAVIEPGRAYTLEMALQSPGFIVVGGDALTTAVNSGVAQSVVLDGDLQPAATSVPFRLEGIQRITQTEEHDPISRVSLALQMESGEDATGSAGVTSQIAVPGLWKGVIPGETEILEQ